jgi:glycosyltransferase involved in cell wall biosynthesis
MRINYIMMGVGLTGGVRVLFEIANGLVSKGHEVTITATGDKSGHSWFPLQAQIDYAPIIRIRRWEVILYRLQKALGPNLNLFRCPQLTLLAGANPDCDINVATLCFTAYSAIAAHKGVPFYHMQHYEPLFFEDKHSKKMAERTYHLPLHKIANSIWLKNLLKEKYGYNIPVVNPAVQHDVFYPRTTENKTGRKYILSFGKQARFKGFPEALKAFKIVARQRPDVKLKAYGMTRPTYESDSPFEFIKSPSDEELAQIYSSAELMICPSWYESFPLFPLEAMACGCPVITTPYGTEDYAFHQENCLVVSPKDPGQLADAVLRLLEDEDLRERFKKQGPRTAKKFTWDKTISAVESLFERALKTSDGS